ncbi:MAG: hypothetical protein K2K72_06755, partial [Duncaniella sp.]|nr:hypothetical protein [Duncaniella sp.]
GWKTVAIPVVVALLIWSKLPVVSNPILYIVLGGAGGWWWLSRHQRQLHEAEAQMRSSDSKMIDEERRDEQ